jgi:hypothetical protein
MPLLSRIGYMLFKIVDEVNMFIIEIYLVFSTSFTYSSNYLRNSL